MLGLLACADSLPVGTEADLNAAIACFNARTTAGVATITLTRDIDLTASTTEIKNATAGASLVIEGAGFAVDGKGTAGVRVFWVQASTHVTMNQITVKGANMNNVTGAGIRNDGNLTLTTAPLQAIL